MQFHLHWLCLVDLKLKIEKHPFRRILLSWCLFEIVNTGRGKFRLHYHNHSIPVVFVYNLFHTIRTMCVFELYCKLQYTYSLITLAFILTNFSCVVESQAVCNEWVNCLLTFILHESWSGDFLLKGNLLVYIFFLYFEFSTLDGCCIGYFMSPEKNKCESKLNTCITYRKQLLWNL